MLVAGCARSLLPGAALQNNLHELWALLSFLMPDIFSSGADFDAMFSASEVDSDVSAKLLDQLHKILRPFMLRRLKAQVATDLPPKREICIFTGMSELQAKLYRGVLERDIDAVLGRVKEKSRRMNSQRPRAERGEAPDERQAPVAHSLSFAPRALLVCTLVRARSHHATAQVQQSPVRWRPCARA